MTSTEKPYPFNEAQEAWLRDLETTTEPQTKGALHRLFDHGDTSHEDFRPTGFCCLGRACVVLGVTGQVENDVEWFDGDDAWLSEEIYTKLRLRSGTGYLLKGIDRDGPISLTSMNDRGWTFKEIAAYIRANPWNVFLPPEEEGQ